GSAELKECYESVDSHLRGSVSTPSMLAATAAWTKGDNWLKSTMALLRENRDYLTTFVLESGLGLKYSPPQGTYLAWLDFRETKAAASPQEFLLSEAKVALSPGPDFGQPGIGWARLNFATKPEILSEMFERIGTALS
ncbi:MAG: aminotransferase class I/II-fold pyridoxal phosphate-dependent enzyme, partial [Candidatus Marsarchaeota archaeon]|nr:aminotransferase class I/II-fold pyridoxal phosphate-dependent enzyme [Candidatus Marsarchaeota archaeon]